MDPVLMSKLLSSGLGLMGGLIGGPDQQERRPFNGMSSNGQRLSPSELLGNSLSMLYSTAGMMQDQYSKPINLRTAYAQPVPGLSGVDPAYTDRSLLRRPGLNFEGGPNNPGTQMLGMNVSQPIQTNGTQTGHGLFDRIKLREIAQRGNNPWADQDRQ